MKDSRVGAYGAIGVVLMLGLKWASLDALAVGTAVFAPLVIGAHLMSRWCAGALMWSLPYVRTDGDSKSRAAVEGFTVREWLIGGIIGLVVFAPMAASCLRESGVVEAWALLAGAVSAAAAACGCSPLLSPAHRGPYRRLSRCRSAIDRAGVFDRGLAVIHPASGRAGEIAWRSI